MKIRIKNNKLTEDIQKVVAPGNPIQKQEKSVVDLYQLLVKRQYLQEMRRNSLPVKISIPSVFVNPINMPKSPIDINNLIMSAQTNKARKTRDFEKWGIVDPMTTYNEASDICAKTFDSFFKQKIQLTGDKTEIALNKSKHISNESYEPVNESLFMSGMTVGAITGSTTAGVLLFLGGAGMAFTGAVLPTVAIGTLALTGIGKLIGENTDAVAKGASLNQKYDNALSNINKNMLKNIGETPMNYGNVVEAIDKYIEDLEDSVGNLLNSLCKEMVEPYNNEFVSYVDDFILTETKQATKFIEENKRSLLKRKEEIANRREARSAKNLRIAEEQLKFNDNLIKIASKQNVSSEFIVNMQNIVKFYNNHYDDENLEVDVCGDLEYAVKSGDSNKVLSTYKSLKNKLDIKDSIQYSNTLSVLNEETANTNEETNDIVIPLAKMYMGIEKELKTRMATVISKFNSKNMTGVDDVKEHMKFLIDAADETIKNRIQLITKAQASPSSGNNAGIGLKAMQFLVGHPLEANNLIEVWSRHVIDLRQRMSSRIKTMTDDSNPTRTLGWTLEYCRTTIPAFFAQLLCYRYAYAILSNEGLYSYDTELAKKDAELFDDPSTGIQDTYALAPHALILWVLNNYIADYTKDNKNCILLTENGYKLDKNNYLAYASLLLKQINYTFITNNKIGVYANEVANLANAPEQTEEKAFNDLISIVYGNILQSNRNANPKAIPLTIPATTEDELQALVDTIKMPDNIKDLKPLIQQSYEYIKDEITKKILNKLNGENAAKEAKNISNSLYIVAQVGESLYEKLRQSKYNDRINEVLDNYEKAKLNNNLEILNNIRRDFHEVFKDIKFPEIKEANETEYITALKKAFTFTPENGNPDYYTFILSWFNKFNMPIEKLFEPENIKLICAMAVTLLKITTTDILLYIKNEDVEELVSTEKIDDVINNVKEPCEKLSTYKNVINNNDLINSVQGDDKEKFDYCKNILDKQYNLIITDITNNYEKLNDLNSNENKAKYKTNKSIYKIAKENFTPEFINSVIENIGSTETACNTEILKKLIKDNNIVNIVNVNNLEKLKAAGKTDKNAIVEPIKDKNSIDANNYNIMVFNLVNAFNINENNNYKLFSKLMDDAMNILNND